MERRRAFIDGALGIAVFGLVGLAWSQGAEIHELEESIARMEARVNAVAAPTRAAGPVAVTGVDDNPKAATAQAPAPTAPDGVAIAPVVPRLPTGKEPEQFDASDPVIRGQLREVIAEEQEILQAERWQERAQRREQRLRTRVAELAEKTEMDETISEQLTDLLVVEQAEASEIFRQAREDFSWDEARKKVEELRTQTDEKAKDLLENEEYGEYQDMRAQESERWARGRGGGGNRGTRAPTESSSGRKNQ